MNISDLFVHQVSELRPLFGYFIIIFLFVLFSKAWIFFFNKCVENCISKQNNNNMNKKNKYMPFDYSFDFSSF